MKKIIFYFLISFSNLYCLYAQDSWKERDRFYEVLNSSLLSADDGKTDSAVSKLSLLENKEKLAKVNSVQNPISLTHDQWNELLRKKVLEICKSDFPKEYSEYVSDMELTGLPSKDDEIVYNVSRDDNNIISLSNYSSNGQLEFLVPAFKKAFNSLTKNQSYIVPSAVRKYYDYKTSQSYDFRMKMRN